MSSSVRGPSASVPVSGGLSSLWSSASGVASAATASSFGAAVGNSTASSRYMEVDACLEGLRNGRLLSVPQIKFVCEKLTEVLLTESNVRCISSPVTVVGDVHG